MGDYYCLGGPPGAEIGVLREAVDLPFWRFSGTRSSPERFFIQRSRKNNQVHEKNDNIGIALHRALAIASDNTEINENQ